MPPRPSDPLLRALTDAAEIGVILLDNTGTVILWNVWMTKASGIAGDRALGRRLEGIFPELGRASAIPEAVGRALATGMTSILSSSLNKNLFPLRHESRATGRDDSMRQIVVVKPLPAEPGRACLVQVFDITAMSHRETLLRQQAKTMQTLVERHRRAEQQTRAIVDTSAEAILAFDETGLVSTCNPAAERIFGHSVHDMMGGPIARLVPALTGPDGAIHAAPFLDRRAEVEGVRRDGGRFSLELSLSAMEDPDGRRRFVAIGNDITERKQAQERIRHLAHHDPLTGLPNRVLFQDTLRQTLEHARARGQRAALLCLDIDKLKDVNDTLGHRVGDLLLKALARRLRQCVPETNLVARLSGDDFAVILNEIATPQDAAAQAEALMAATTDPFALDEHEVAVSASIGITLFPDDAGSAERLLKNADLALSRAKSEGRDTYRFFLQEMDAEIRARKTVEGDLRRALGSDQFELHYQPLIDVCTGRITGCEALVRWRHPRLGWISPADFIPVAERTDLIQPLGRWILHRACQQGRAWEEDGLPPLEIAVNLSPLQFRHHRALLATVADTLDQTGMRPDRLQLEITEGIAMQNVEDTIQVLRQFRAMGVEISIDDFGTGYSSLNYLRRFPVDKLKIDRSFIVDIAHRQDDVAVVEAIVKLGHSLGTRVNVEGIETHQQLAFLADQKVDEAQGFLFSPAVPADDFARLVRGSSPWPMPPVS